MTLVLSESHLIKFKRFCKQQRLEQQTVAEYLIDYAVFHNLNIHLPLPKNKQLNPASIHDLNALKVELKAEWIRFSRNLNTPESERVPDRVPERMPEQDEQIRQLTRQLSEQTYKTRQLEYLLDQLTAHKKQGGAGHVH